MVNSSIVIAVFNEHENVASVCEDILRKLEPAAPFEVIWVDDGSTDSTAAILQEIADKDPRVRLVRHGRRCGKSQAVRTGVLYAKGKWIATLDGDGQNEPDDLPPMLAKAAAAPGKSPIVAGVRVRRDDPMSRLVATRIANGFRSAVLGDKCPDTGCGMKVFEREAFLLLPCFEGMHRFLPALFQRYGHPLINHEVRHHPRLKGASKYTNWGRAIVGIFDMMGVIWLNARTRAPLSVSENGRTIS
jgi:dolichol-phosphate mannosyltransferase